MHTAIYNDTEQLLEEFVSTDYLRNEQRRPPVEGS